MACSLTRYWVEVQLPKGRQFGVTAYSLDDARSLIFACAAYPLGFLPMVVVVWPNIDVSTLDASHVLPNMLPPNWRGVWYPIS